jgi:glycosyltransferase involved in cell wall biosynthesis
MELGHEVIMVCLLEGSAQLPFRGKIVYLNRPITRRLVDVKGWKQLASLIHEIKPDLVQANAGDTLKYAVLSKLFFRWKTPIIFRNASTISQYIKSGPARKWNAFLFRQVRAVISVSAKSKQDFLSLFPFMQGRIHVVPVGLELQQVPAAAKQTKPYLLHVGGFTFEKNHERLLYIFQKVTKEYLELELWLAGDGPLRTKIEEQAKAMGIVDRIKFLGYRKDVLTIMQKAKVLVLPSIIEGLPGVILEAMYCRTPVVAYAVGGIPEVVKTGVTGWLVKTGDEVSFINAVVEVIEKNDHNEIIENAYQMVVREFDNRVIAGRFVVVYREVGENSRIGEVEN